MTPRHPHLHLIHLHTNSLLLIPAPEVWAWKETPHVSKPPRSSTFMSGLFLVINWLCSSLGDISLEKFLSLEAKLENQFPWVLSRTRNELQDNLFILGWLLQPDFYVICGTEPDQQGFCSIQLLSAEAETHYKNLKLHRACSPLLVALIVSTNVCKQIKL